MNARQQVEDWREAGGYIPHTPVSSSHLTLLPDDASADPTLSELDALYTAADSLSVEAALLHRRTLALLAWAGTILTLAFLLYDEASLLWMIMVVGAMLLAEGYLERRAVSSDNHGRYVEYRALAECLRVQAYLRYAGTSISVSSLLSFTQKDEMPWVANVMEELSSKATPPQAAHDIRFSWLEGQRNYHEQAGRKSALQLARSEQIVRSATAASIILYLFALGFELACGGWLLPPIIQTAHLSAWRAGLKIALGSMSAASLFVSGYYDNLSVPRVYADHQRLERFYAQMEDRIAKEGQTDALLVEIAREELMENANWCSYQQDDAPNLTL